jgi:hypothetical protein
MTVDPQTIAYGEAAGLDMKKHEGMPPGSPEAAAYLKTINLENFCERNIGSVLLLVFKSMDMEPARARVMCDIYTAKYAHGQARIFREWLQAYGVDTTLLDGPAT